MKPRPCHRMISQLTQIKWSLDDALGQLRAMKLHIESAERLGGGIEFEVFVLRFRGRAPIVLKFPSQRWIFNDNDQGLDSFSILQQEYALLVRSHRYGIPAPNVIGYLHPDEGPHVLVIECIETDAVPVDDFQLGRIVKRLHELSSSGIHPVAQRGQSASTTVAQLTAARMAVVARFAELPGTLPTKEFLAHHLRPIDLSPSLLHMDLRPANFLSRDGRLLGLIDWSNALTANPLLELARVEEYGGLTDRFASGYGSSDLRTELQRPLGLCCRLYTAAMLAVVFLSEAPDRSLATIKVKRLKDLLEQLRAVSDDG
ncbi:phosphotransferase family protein [Bradyrhizobium elkanii]|uniref:phosphotransferase family protein n=1 Tax=Bradyrhizobium elkanii TaxID=29448 RepID=UPI00209FC6B1|nr:phosphotransferase [Bradyrhizobium elkanii]MCP1926378.1 hypothetical protein [Bradyrhizobium elkanii]